MGLLTVYQDYMAEAAAAGAPRPSDTLQPVQHTPPVNSFRPFKVGKVEIPVPSSLSNAEIARRWLDAAVHLLETPTQGPATLETAHKVRSQEEKGNKF